VVKEIYYTLQGEGGNVGRAAVFCRFTGCNLWSGREEDRAGAICRFCDTDFVGTDGPNGGKFASSRELAIAIANQWPASALQSGRPLVVFTGGEPLLQMDEELIDAIHAAGFEIAIETNGTRLAPRGIDWVCVSPKAGAALQQRFGNELKLVYPQVGAEPALFEQLAFDHFFLQPMDGPDRLRNTELCVRYCLQHPLWRLSLQTHKVLGMR
jgi:7-carboxy-7-deazaguanine synthase